MTIHTIPGYGIAYADADTPAVQLADVSYQVATTLHNALVAGGLAPPSTPDLAAAVARIAALETPNVTAVTLDATAGTGAGALAVPGFAPVSFYKIGQMVRLRSVFQAPPAGIASGRVVFTLPAGFRPSTNTATPAFTNNAGAYGVAGFDMTTAGAFKPQGAIAANVYVYLDHIAFLNV